MAQPRLILQTNGKLSRKNASGGTIPAGYAVKQGAAQDEILPCAANDDACIGITGNAVLTLEYCDIIVAPGSVVPMINNGGVTIGDRLMPHTDGTAKTYAAAGGVNVSLLGIAMETVATGVLGEVMYAGPGVSRQG